MAGNWDSAFWQYRLVLGTWNITSFVGNKPKMVRELECYWLDRLDSLQRIALALEPGLWRGAGLSPFMKVRQVSS